MLDYILGLDLPEEIVLDPRLQRARDAVCEHTALINDLFSFGREGRERREGQWPFNALGVLHFHDGLALQDAVDVLRRLLAEREQLVLDVTDDILNSPWKNTPGVAAYLVGLADMLDGNVFYHLFSPRYGGRGYVWDAP
ncbi:hypothetical protein P8605_05755 [Streptomyces sp. T-3]|nr:hypothetical protein [Streptomyces sp. T-3]